MSPMMALYAMVGIIRSMPPHFILGVRVAPDNLVPLGCMIFIAGVVGFCAAMPLLMLLMRLRKKRGAPAVGETRYVGFLIFSAGPLIFAGIAFALMLARMPTKAEYAFQTQNYRSACNLAESALPRVDLARLSPGQRALYAAMRDIVTHRCTPPYLADALS